MRAVGHQVLRNKLSEYVRLAAGGELILIRGDEALQQLAVLQAQAESHYVPALAMAVIRAGLNQGDEAFALIERACDVRDPWLSQSLTINATLDPLRADARFQALLRRMNFPKTPSSW